MNEQTVSVTIVLIAIVFTKTRAQRSCAYARRGRGPPKWLACIRTAFGPPGGRQMM